MRPSWSKWSIATKILVPFLMLSIATMALIASVALSNIRTMGRHALQTSTALGTRAIDDSTLALTKLGEDMIRQIAGDVGNQVEDYLNSRPAMSPAEMRVDSELRRIAIRPVGTTGYTTILDPSKKLIVVHKFIEQERDISSLANLLPSFWSMFQAQGPTSGYYDWQEVDGRITQKYASIFSVRLRNGTTLQLWATTYIEEFSAPALATQENISEAIASSGTFISRSVDQTQQAFIVAFTALVIVVIALSLLISWFITTPILALKAGAEAIARGDLDYKLTIKNQDELGDLAKSFNEMANSLRSYTQELKRSAETNVAREREVQDNLRHYAQKVGQAQEAERKRVARELHDETLQALVVIARKLDDMGAGVSQTDASAFANADAIRKEVRQVIDGVRRFSQELRPSILDDLGLVPALKWLCSDLTAKHGIQVETDLTDTAFRIKPEMELMLFRIAQEALTNVRKHSQATSVKVDLTLDEDSIRLVIRDNGRGFAVPVRLESLTETGRLGLVGMLERVQLLGGSLVVDSTPEAGTSVSVQVPKA
jgi:signal transduction histidine kinase